MVRVPVTSPWQRPLCHPAASPASILNDCEEADGPKSWAAGISMEDIAGSNTAVFTGTFTEDYRDQLAADPLHAPRGFITGNYTAMIANRISHFFDLKGPSAAVDTGCSTSLVNLHLACQSLRAGESDRAIVGGACINLSPDVFASLSTLG